MSDRPANPLLPFLVAGLGIAVFSMMDAAMKSASLQVGAYNALLFRSLIGAALMLPVWRLGPVPTNGIGRDGADFGPAQGARKEPCHRIVTDEQRGDGPKSARREAVALGSPLNVVSRLARDRQPALRRLPSQRASQSDHGLCHLWVQALCGGRWPGRANLKVHMLRSTVVAGMAWLFFWGLMRIPLAEGIALSFIAPLIALFLAAVLLGERIRRSAVLASLLGLAGVGVIGAGRFGSAAFEPDDAWGVAAVLASAVLYAWNLVLQRQQALLAGPREVALFQHLCVALVLALFAPWFAQLPPPAAWRDIALGGILAASALMLLSWAYARAEAQTLVTVEYTAFIWASLMGWLIFGEVVTLWTVAGVVLIVAGCWIAARKPTEQTAL